MSRLRFRRVATLVARGVAPGEVFAAVTAEVGQVLGVDVTMLSRYDPDGTATVAAGRTVGSGTGDAMPSTVGSRRPLGGGDVHTQVYEARRPARMEDDAGASDAAADLGRELGLRSVVDAPIEVEGRLWA